MYELRLKYLRIIENFKKTPETAEIDGEYLASCQKSKVW